MDSWARQSRFRNHPSQHSETKPGSGGNFPTVSFPRSSEASPGSDRNQQGPLYPLLSLPGVVEFINDSKWPRPMACFPPRSRDYSFAIQVAEDARAVLPASAARQALLALVKNALESSTDGQRGTLAAQCAAGKICFTVQDTGCGMAPETLSRISEPFYTTKGPRRGLGLGTFIARLFAERLHGSLVFESEVGAGTRAILELPPPSS